MKTMYYFNTNRPECGISQFTVLSEIYLVDEAKHERSLFSINTHFDVTTEKESEKSFSMNIFQLYEDEDIYGYNTLNTLTLSYDKKKLEKLWESKINSKEKSLKEKLFMINNLKGSKEEWLRSELSEFSYSDDFFSKILEIVDNVPSEIVSEDKILELELTNLRRKYQKKCDKLEDIRKYIEKQPTKDKTILEIEDILERKYE